MALRSYERGRMRFAAGWVIAVLTGILPVLGLAHERAAVACLGLLLAVMVAWCAFRGQVAYAAARNGLLGGLVPLSLALCMRDLGQCYSIGGYCFSWCVAGCALGGAAASLVILKLAGRWRTSPTYWGLASLVLLLTGSLACGCAGVMGLAGLAVGYVAGMGPMRRLVLAT